MGLSHGFITINFIDYFMKKVFAGAMMVAFMATATVTPTNTAHAQTADEQQVITLQLQVVELLQRLLAILTGGSHDSMMNDDMMKSDDKMSDSVMEEGKYTLTLDTDLAELSEGYYEGWLIVGDDKISTGLFQEGGEQTFHFDTPIADIEKVVITIEPEEDPDAGPSGIIVLAGDVVDGGVDLAFPVDFSDAAGSAILATPTDGNSEDETSGVWFLSIPGPEAAGWVYEGWGVYEGTPLPTGKFTAADEGDDFDGFSGTAADAPPFPGEDFLRNAPDGVDFPIDLADGESLAVISVEPDLDGVDPTGNGPAQVKPLVAHIEEGQGDHENFDLELNPDSVPSGTATLQ